MGHIFVLSGASCVGKTTFLYALAETHVNSQLKLLPRFTDRPIRPNEKDGFEYFFVDHDGFLQKVYANDFVHVEKWGDYYSGIDKHSLEEILNSDYHGIVLASTYGAARLRASYGVHVTHLYMWTDHRQTLLHPRCMKLDSPEIKELTWRMKKKLSEQGFSEYETEALVDEQFLQKRMIDNFLDIAAVNGRLRNGENIEVLPSIHNKICDTVDNFNQIRKRVSNFGIIPGWYSASGCFVLMPFRSQLRPIYDDHIVKVCTNIGLTVTRADQIFSSRPIIDDILESVASAKVIIADLTDNNPNVFYEIGICHTLGKNVVLMTQENEVPFDLRHIRHIKYEYTPRGMPLFEYQLTKTLQSVVLS
ncbi:MAG: hypothetical protein ACYDBB_24815 [Armatimonadota bacterium]